MFQESDNIVIIDDDQSQLDQLAKVFHDKGVGCKAIKYDGVNISPLKGVKVLFLDINLNSSMNNDDLRNITLRDAIIQYIREDNGPYMLVFWTSDTTWIQSFTNYVNGRLDDDIRKRNPYYIAQIDKTKFINNETELSDKVRAIFSSDTINTLINFTSIISASAWETMSKIIDIIPKSDKWGDIESFENNARSVFSKLAIDTIGFENAKISPDKAIKEAVVPVFAHNIINDSKVIWKNYLVNLSNTQDKNQIQFPENFHEERLNTILLIDNNVSENTCRGAVIKIKQEMFDKYFQISFDDWLVNEFGSNHNLKNAYPIAVEFSAACDFSQQNKRTNRYLVGIVSEEIVKNKKQKENILTSTLPAVEFKGKKIYWALNLNYSFVNLSHESCLGEIMFGLKKEIMDMIGNKYANHISRIGITSFR